MDQNNRPTRFDDYVGQREAIANLRVFVASAKARNTSVDHILFTGPPGLGKTSVANVLANEIGSQLHVINATTLKAKGDLIAVLSRLSRTDVLFIDEIHALSSKVEEVLYTAMEDNFIDIAANGETVRLELEPFTLIGATTNPGKVSRPLLDRFGDVVQMEPYSVSEIAQIVKGSVSKLGLAISEDAAMSVAERSQGVPRVANKLVRRIRDFAFAFGIDSVSVGVVERVSESLGVDKNGLDKASRAYIASLAKAKKPMGINTIASILNMDEDTILNNVEPYLFRMGWLTKTVNGRYLTSEGMGLA